MKRNFWIPFIFIPLILSACKATTSQPEKIAPVENIEGQKVEVAGGSYTDVSVNELQSMLSNKDFLFVNVHIPFEGDITDTDVSIPYDEIDQHLAQLPADKGAKIVLYCRSGRMSSIAAEKLAGLGYTHVWNVSGGMVAWEQAGLPIKH